VFEGYRETFFLLVGWSLVFTSGKVFDNRPVPEAVGELCRVKVSSGSSIVRN